MSMSPRDPRYALVAATSWAMRAIAAKLSTRVQGIRLSFRVLDLPRTMRIVFSAQAGGFSIASGTIDVDREWYDSRILAYYQSSGPQSYFLAPGVETPERMRR